MIAAGRVRRRRICADPGGAKNEAPPGIAVEFLDLEKRFCADRAAYDRLNRLLERARDRIATKESYTTEEAIRC